MNIGSTTVEAAGSRFSRQVVLTLGARMLIAAGSLLAGVIVARWLGAASVGILASLNVMTLVALTFGGIGLPSAITFLVARDREKLMPVLMNTVAFAAVAGTLSVCTIIILTRVRLEFFGGTPAKLVTIAAFAIPFQFLQLCSLGIFLGRGNIVRYNLFDILAQALLVINPLIMLVLLGLGLQALVTANASTAAILSLITLVVLLRTGRPQTRLTDLRLDLKLMGEMFRYGSKFYVAMASAVIILRADLLIVNYFRGNTEAGVYAVSTQVGTLLMLLPGVISTVLFPRVTEARDASVEMTCRVTRHASLIMLIVCLGAIPLALALPTLYGTAFGDVPFQVFILLPGVYLLGIETVQVQYFNSQGLPKAIPAFWLVTMVTNVILDLIFVPRFGAYAAAAVSSISYAMMFILVATYFKTKTQKSFAETFLISGREFRGLLRMPLRAAG